jgi:hypothetical protein
MAEKSNLYSDFQPFLKNFEIHFLKNILEFLGYYRFSMSSTSWSCYFSTIPNLRVKNRVLLQYTDLFKNHENISTQNGMIYETNYKKAFLKIFYRC